MDRGYLETVDLLLGLDLAAHATRRDVAHVVLVSGDSDLVPAVQRARDEGLTVWLCHGNSHARDLWQSCDRRVPLAPDWVPRRERKTSGPGTPGEGC